MKIVQYFQNNKRHEVEHEVKQGLMEFLKSSYGVLQESHYLMSCMIFEENYFSGYILLISLPGYLKADIEQYICCNC